MTHVVTIGNATVDAAKFAAYNKKAQEELAAEAKHKEDAIEAGKDFKETVESVAQLTKLSKPEVAKYFKARYEEAHPKKDDKKGEKKPIGTKVVINRGELYTVLNSVLEK